jgi:hypothetical protein
MKYLDNDHLFCYNDNLQQELQLALVDEEVSFFIVDTDTSLSFFLAKQSFNERDLEVLLDSVGCIDHPA